MEGSDGNMWCTEFCSEMVDTEVYFFIRVHYMLQSSTFWSQPQHLLHGKILMTNEGVSQPQ